MITRTVSELAELCEASLEGEGGLVIEGPASLQVAGPSQISFCSHPRYRRELAETRAGCVLVARDLAVERSDLALLRCDDPNRAFSAVIQSFAKPAERPPQGVHPSAVVDPSAELGEDVSIGPQCVVGARARIGDRSVLHAHVAVGTDVRIGDDSELFSMVVLYRDVEIGARCVLHGGAVIGADGLGFEPRPEGWVKIPQCGTVVVEDDVEIGSNTAIDRARFGATRIGRGAKIDNLVHIAHSVQIGAGAMLIAQVGIAGSSHIGRGAILAGKAGVVGHVRIGDGAQVGGSSAVWSDVPPGARVFGIPARPQREALRGIANAARVPQLEQRIADLERALEALKGASGAPS